MKEFVWNSEGILGFLLRKFRLLNETEWDGEVVEDGRVVLEWRKPALFRW